MGRATFRGSNWMAAGNIPQRVLYGPSISANNEIPAIQLDSFVDFTATIRNSGQHPRNTHVGMSHSQLMQ